MFDSNAIIEITARSEAGLATIELRWPTDEEWNLRARGRKILMRRLGRGQSETIIEAGDADLKLYEKIRTNGGLTLTAAEATRVIEAIGLCEATDVEINGNEATVSLEAISGPLTHTLRLPRADEVVNFRRAAYRLVELPFNKQELKLNPDAGARLWDACGGKSADYTGPVPGMHKDVAVRAVIDFLDREVTAKQDETHF